MFRSLAQNSFRHQLTRTLTVSILMLVLSTSLINGWIITDRLTVIAIDTLRQLTAQFGASSAFAFLVEDVAVAKRAVVSIGAFPGVRYVAILKKDFSPLAIQGEPVNWTPFRKAGAGWDRPALAYEDPVHWHFIAPVTLQPADSPYDDKPVSPEHLGYVHVVWAKALLTKIKVLIFVTTTVIAFGIAGFVMAWLRHPIKRLSEPLSDLVMVMQQAYGDERGIRARIAGPTETREIGRVYNELIDKLEQQKATLESEVAKRTFALGQALDEAQAAARCKSEFMAVMTHEMRTPLHAITGYSQLIMEELPFMDDPEMAVRIAGYLNVVCGSAGELLQRVNQILDLARADAGKLDVELQAVNLHRLFSKLLETVRPQAERNHNTLALDLQGDPQLIIDGEKLGEIVLNLLTNACKFTQQGAVSVRVVRSERSLAIEVVDTGIGIAQDQQQAIFEPFLQLDMSDTRRYGGSGLGLAISKRFCELLGGSIRVESEPSRGSCFRVVIPLPLEQRFNGDLLSCGLPGEDAASGTPEVRSDTLR